MEQLLAPQALKDGNLAESWKKFIREFTQFLEATEKTDADPKVKTAILLRVIGARGNDIYENFSFGTGERQNYDTVIAKFDEFCAPQEETFISRHRLLCMKQEGQSIEEFETRLRTQARLCKLGDLTEDLICHAFVEGVDDRALRDKLLVKACEQELKLPAAIKLAREFTTAKAHMRELGEESQETVHRLYEKKSSSEVRGAKKEVYKDSKETRKAQCSFCGLEHRKGNCPAYGKECTYCHRKNHFERVCREKKEKEGRKEECRAIESKLEYGELFTIEDHPKVKKQGSRLLTTLHWQKQTIVCQLDTASARNVMSNTDYEKLGSPSLSSSDVILVQYNGSEMKSKGRISLTFDEIEKPIIFEVVESSMRPYPLLGCDVCIELSLVKLTETAYALKEDYKLTKEQILTRYDEVFRGLGEMPGEYEIKIDKTVKPVQHRPRRTPVMMRDDVIKKVKELEAAGILSKVEDPTDWISSQVAVRKPNGTIRLCLDPKDLNKAIVRNHYQIPTLDDVLPRLAKAKCFSLLDAKDGFWQVKLAESSKKLTTFWTPLGRYCWNRLPFGLSSSPEEYQRRLHMVLDGLKGVEVIADDILVFGVGEDSEEARKDHDNNLVTLLERVLKVGVKINRQKMKLHLSEVKYMGHVLTAEGVKADPDKVQGIKDLRDPESAEDVRSFLGTVNYLARYIPQLSQLAAPLRESIAAEDFVFREEDKKAWNKLKEAISEDTMLRYFDPTIPAVIECDASGNGLGAVLLQGGKPVYFASRTLSDAESRYHPLELECLAVVFACGKFDQYIYGKHDLTILSDHRPLESIMKKEMEKSPVRLGKMLMALQRYGYDLKYKPGKEQVLADMLSRSSTATEIAMDFSKVEVFINDIDDSNPEEFTNLTDKRLAKVREFATTDDIYILLKEQIRRGWPEKRKGCDALIQDYWTFADELSERNGLVYKGKRLVIPRNMEKDICVALHGGHSGADAMMLRARDILYWPGMWNGLKAIADECEACQKVKPANKKEHLRVHEVPKHRFLKVGSDVLYHHGKTYLVVVDYMSDYIELKELEDETTTSVINACKEIFARHGVPEQFHSDNAPYYSCSQFQKFAEDWQFIHTSSSPGHAQSNGKAESAVKIVKHILDTSEDPWRALMEWRATPNRDFPSPSERLYNRKIRTLVPQSIESLEDQEIDLEKIAMARKLRQHRMALTYDKGKKPLSTLQHGQPVMVKQVKNRIEKWRPATVLESVSDRSYLVKNDKENIIRRNRVDLQDVPRRLSTDHAPVMESNSPRKLQQRIIDRRSSNSQEIITPDQQENTSRSGRIIKRPGYLRDYTD